MLARMVLMTVEAVSRLRVTSSPYGCLGPLLGPQIVKYCVDTLIPKMAGKLHRRLSAYISLDDLISVGNEALAHSLQRYRPVGTQPLAVEFYANFHSRLSGAMFDYLREQDHLSRDLRKFQKSKESASYALLAKGVFYPSDQQMADELRVSLERYRDLTARVRFLDCLCGEVPLDELSRDRSMMDGFFFGEAPSPELCDSDGLPDVNVVELVADVLSPRERIFLDAYYRDDLTLRQIGIRLGVTESRVSQLKGEIIQKLKAAAQARIDKPVPRRVPAPPPRAQAAPPPRVDKPSPPPPAAAEVVAPSSPHTSSSPLSALTQQCLDTLRRRCSKKLYRGMVMVHTPRALLSCHPPHLLKGEAGEQLKLMESQGLIRWIVPPRPVGSYRRPQAFIVLL